MDFSKTSLWEKLNNIIKIYIPSDQQKLIKQAFEVAYDAHSGQKRGSGEPYITHPVNVACKLAKLHLDHETIMAGLLHDVVEDTPVTKEQITEKGDTTFVYKIATNPQIAKQLKGHLLLIHGDIDNNVHPGNTLRVVDALIRAGKRFDMLILPQQRHGFGDMNEYFYWRLVDYFSEHLRGKSEKTVDIPKR